MTPHPSVALAPMAGVTDRVFRDLCRAQGADYTVSEMVASQAHLQQSAKSATRHADPTEAEPRIVQLLGVDAQALAQAARFQVSQGAQIIDLNMGCPAKKVCRVAAGSALMGQPQNAARLFEALVKAVDCPITVKLRTGIHATKRNVVEMAQIAEDSGLSGVTIHGRTRADKFQGQAEYDSIAEVKQAVQIPVIANGDICTPKQALNVLEYTHADGIMIGRAAQGYPWIFREIKQFLQTGVTPPRPSLKAFYQTIMAHIGALPQLYGSEKAPKIARKHLGWYSQHLPEGAQLRRAFNRLNHTDDQLAWVDQFFTQLCKKH